MFNRFVLLILFAFASASTIALAQQGGTSNGWPPGGGSPGLPASGPTGAGQGISSPSAGVSSFVQTSFNIRAFGANGDGSTDDTAAIQAAHNAACTAGGGQVYYPQGTYLFTPVSGAYAGTFLICSNMTIKADGAILRVKPNAGNYWAIYQSTVAVNNFGTIATNGVCVSYAIVN